MSDEEVIVPDLSTTVDTESAPTNDEEQMLVTTDNDVDGDALYKDVSLTTISEATSQHEMPISDDPQAPDDDSQDDSGGEGQFTVVDETPTLEDNSVEPDEAE